MFEFKTIRELYEAFLNGEPMELEGLEYVELEGWVRTNRNNGKLGFVALNDGTYFKNCQIVYLEETLDNYEEVSKLGTGSALRVVGKFKLTPDGKQPFEVEATEIEIEGKCDDDFPLQKKRHSLEYLREIPHLRPRTNTFMATFRIRSLLAMAIHEFFQSQGFVYIHAPLITGNDAEGAGEAFTVTTREDGNYEEDFFNKHASLTVSGQLHVESFAMAFRDVYTFGPTFRAENSNTSTHASEFWMIEPEIAFADLEDDMDLIEDCIKYCIQYVLENAPAEMEFLNQFVDKELLERLQHVKDSEFKRLDYTDAIDILKKSGKKFKFPVEWGIDLATEHERYLCEEVVKGPVFLINYPKDIKAFYMRINDDNKTVAACDLLVPGIGELVGGSQREERYDVLEKRMKEMGMELEELQWYLDLRRYGGVNHAGFGIGFERFIMYMTGITNIRDVIPYPRTPRNLKF
ncbi:MAG: asparagine--tRNA ligase [Coprobacillaceae bacterium]